MIYPILTYSNSELRSKSEDISISLDEYDSSHAKEHFKKITDDMFETMHNRDGVGLALPQIGLPGRIIVIDTKISDSENFRGVFINPYILDYFDDKITTIEEGCLSLPGISYPVVRPDRISVQYYDENLIFHKKEFEGIISRILQHEIDHLEGILFIDRIGDEGRNDVFSKLEK